MKLGWEPLGKIEHYHVSTIKILEAQQQFISFMQIQTTKRYYTPEEYLTLEEAAEFKSEYRDGEIVPMTV